MSLGNFARLGVVGAQPKRACPKPSESIRAKKGAADKQDDASLRQWRAKVYALDGYRCRKCGRRVVAVMDHLPEQANAHHLVSRKDKAVRYDVRNGLTLCGTCHDLVTGAVSERWKVVDTKGSKYFKVDGVRTKYLDARAPVGFERVA